MKTKLDLKTRTIIWQAWYELNTIRARDGVPRRYDGTPSDVTEAYFSRVVDELTDLLGDDAVPWSPKE